MVPVLERGALLIESRCLKSTKIYGIPNIIILFILGTYYYSVTQMLDALQSEEVDCVFVDTYALVGYKDDLKNRNIKVY